MAFDFKKEYKEFYLPKDKPQIVTVPAANYIAVSGEGNSNEVEVLLTTNRRRRQRKSGEQ